MNAKPSLKDTDTRALVSKVGRAALLFVATALLSGCISFVRPEGEWAESPDLRLDAEALAGVKLRVDCVLDSGDDQPPSKDDGPNCGKLRVELGYLGATILIEDPPEAEDTGSGSGSASGVGSGGGSGSKALAAPRPRGRNDEPLPRRYGDQAKETPDYAVLYVSRASDSDYCGITILTLLFFGMGPCLEDIDSGAELRVLDVARGNEVRKTMSLKVRRILGAAALPVLGMQYLRKRGRNEDREIFGRLFLRYLQNTVYTFAARDRIAALAPGEAQR